MSSLKRKLQQRITQAKNRKARQTEKARIVVHPKVKAEIHTAEAPITVAKAKALLGWREETDKEPFGNKFFYKLGERKVRCSNNVNNRPLYRSAVRTLKQEILRKRWQFNGEPIIIGVTGLVLNGQHSLIALIEAGEAWKENRDGYPQWKHEPTIAKLIVYGVGEDDETVNTMDTCKPRSLADVIFRARYFKDETVENQRRLSRIAQSVIQVLWGKTGRAQEFASQTHPESIAFLESHRRILDAVKHVWEENGDNNSIAKLIGLGPAAAMLYLMGTCSTSAQDYYTKDVRTEDTLSFDQWDKACQFFVELAKGSEKLRSVAVAIGKLVDDGDDRWDSRWAILAKAWANYRVSKPVVIKSLALKFETDEEKGRRFLVETPLLGGLDVGEDGFDNFSEPLPTDPKPEQIEERKKEVQDKRNSKKATNNPTKTAGRAAGKAFKTCRKGRTWTKGDKAWVHAKNEEPFAATLVDSPYECVDGVERVLVCPLDTETDCEVFVMDLSLTRGA